MHALIMQAADLRKMLSRKKDGSTSQITYQKSFCFFLWFVMAGTFCAIVKCRWETHVVSCGDRFVFFTEWARRVFAQGLCCFGRKTLYGDSSFFAMIADVIEFLRGLLFGVRLTYAGMGLFRIVFEFPRTY